MTLTDDEAAAKSASADAEQGAYFRLSLDATRRQLLDQILYEQRHGAGQTDDRRHRAILRSAEAEVRYLDRLIDRLDHRFRGHWGHHDDT